jgi:hypothetical protein
MKSYLWLLPIYFFNFKKTKLASKLGNEGEGRGRKGNKLTR